MQKLDEPPPEPKKRVLCRHPFLESKRAYVNPARVEPLHRLYWKDGEVSVFSLEEIDYFERDQHWSKHSKTFCSVYRIHLLQIKAVITQIFLNRYNQGIQ